MEAESRMAQKMQEGDKIVLDFFQSFLEKCIIDQEIDSNEMNALLDIISIIYERRDLLQISP